MTQSNIVLGHLIELVGNIADAYTCALFTMTPDEKKLILIEHFTLSHNLDRGAKISLGKGPIGLAAQTCKPQLIENFDQDTCILGMYKKNEDIKSFIALPIVYSDQIAVLAIDTKEHYQFSIKLQKILSEFAQQVAWNLESKISGSSESQQLILQEINSYCRFLAESPDRSSVADRLTQIPTSMIPCPTIAVTCFEENQLEGQIISHKGFAHDLSEIKVFLGKGLVGSCAKNKSPLLLQIHRGRKSIIFSENEKSEGLQCAAALPIQYGDTLYGVLLVGSPEPEGVTHSDLDKLALIVSSASSALFCADTKEQRVYDKNLDPITGVPNHRFLTEYHLSLSEEVFRPKEAVFFLTFNITNLEELYEIHGVESGDAYLKQMMTFLSKVVPSPKFFFRLSESCFLVLLISCSQKDVALLKSKLEHLLKYNPLYVNGVSIHTEFQWGLSAYPEEGKELFDLINLSRNRMTKRKKAMA